MTRTKLFGPFPVPRQHGAWAMFLVPAVMAASLADYWSWGLPFLVVSFVLVFLSHRPASQILRRWKLKRTLYRPALGWLLFLGGAGLALLFPAGPFPPGGHCHPGLFLVLPRRLSALLHQGLYRYPPLAGQGLPATHPVWPDRTCSRGFFSYPFIGRVPGPGEPNA